MLSSVLNDSYQRNYMSSHIVSANPCPKVPKEFQPRFTYLDTNLWRCVCALSYQTLRKWLFVVKEERRMWGGWWSTFSRDTGKVEMRWSACWWSVDGRFVSCTATFVEYICQCFVVLRPPWELKASFRSCRLWSPVAWQLDFTQWMDLLSASNLVSKICIQIPWRSLSSG